MDCEASKRTLLKQMLLCENEEPTDLPLSLLKYITNNFSEDQEIGRGGFSVVYKGILQNGNVAVKRLSQGVDMDGKDFNQEVINNLIRVKHKNIVRFLGYCGNTQQKVEKYGGKMVMADVQQRLLCFEFLPNGSLDKYICDASTGLDWRTRYQIIKGICMGLDCLHQQRIVHLDLKPANILLDCNMMPKISDFGISRCFDEEQTRAITSNIKGSLGYMAPERYDGKITLKSDIYSLGIIIIEILTGSKTYPKINTGDTSWLEHVAVCSKIGIKCSKNDPTKRPPAWRIIDMLDEMECKHGCTEAVGTSSAAQQPDGTVYLTCGSRSLSGSTVDSSLEAFPCHSLSCSTVDSSLLHGTVFKNNWREHLGIKTGDLKQVIIACGKAVHENNVDYTEALMSELRQMVSISGEPMQRLGVYMFEGLIARLSSTGHALYKSLKCKEQEPVAASSELISYMDFLYEICPFFKFGYMSANAAIADAVKGENFIHIIDFQIAQGSQWMTMIQKLASRPGRRPYLRITGIDDRGGLDIVERRLQSIAQSCGLPFEFNPVPAASHEVMCEHLCIRPGEAIVVNFAYQLHHTPDESVGVENHRDRILRMVKSLSPRVVTLLEQEANTNTAPFFPRYLETLNYYTAMFEAIDFARPRDDKNRISTEQHCVASDIVNLIACEGAERMERHELFKKWRARLAMAGFRPCPLSPVVNNIIKTLLDNYHSYYGFEASDGVLYLGWKNRKLVVSSA